jgi:hypothetical protein
MDGWTNGDYSRNEYAVILSTAKNLKLGILRSFDVFASQDDVSPADL